MPSSHPPFLILFILLLSLRLVHALQVGEWQRPGNHDVRSPCPLFNTAANHGYFPRDGGKISKEKMFKVFEEQFNVSPMMTQLFWEGAKFKGLLDEGGESISLKGISKPGAIEHYASLVRDDHPGEYIIVNQTLVKELLALSIDKKFITLPQLGRFRAKRYETCKASNKNFEFSIFHRMAAYGEAALLVSVFGEPREDIITLDSIKSFLGQERIPKAVLTSVSGTPQRHTTIFTVTGLQLRIFFYSLIPYKTLHQLKILVEGLYYQLLALL